MINTLVRELIKLNQDLGLVGIKQSFEDEGVLLQDVELMRRLTYQAGLLLNIKIGGVEALSDINNCVNLQVDKIVAPMVETEFALQKFTEACTLLHDTDLLVNIESKTGVVNIKKILRSPSSKILSGIVVGRSDLTKSFGLPKNEVDSVKIQKIVRGVFQDVKTYKMATFMGGNISKRSLPFIKELFNDNLLDYIETRNMIIKLSTENIEKLDEVLTSIILFESKWLEFKSNKYSSISEQYRKRAILLKSRLE